MIQWRGRNIRELLEHQRLVKAPRHVRQGTTWTPSFSKWSRVLEYSSRQWVPRRRNKMMYIYIVQSLRFGGFTTHDVFRCLEPSEWTMGLNCWIDLIVATFQEARPCITAGIFVCYCLVLVQVQVVATLDRAFLMEVHNFTLLLSTRVRTYCIVLVHTATRAASSHTSLISFVIILL